jgi:hypothetical protein
MLRRILCGFVLAGVCVTAQHPKAVNSVKHYIFDVAAGLSMLLGEAIACMG